jgi:UDP-N-acetylmuramoyl-tripeptide--D-alanyl-D-alanine ligase
MYTLQELKLWSSGFLASDTLVSESTQVAGACIDSRIIKPLNIFFALPGTQVDGHTYVGVVSGIAGVSVVRRDWYEVHKDTPGVLLVVEDVLETLQNIAREYRKKIMVPIVAITGSNGKTSTKNMIREVLSPKYQVCATQGNLNNHIGLPISILSMKDTDQVGVFELGMNHPGEILFLTEIVKPNIAVVTGIGTAHIEFFQNQEGIAHEKASIFSFLIHTDLAVFPKTDLFFDILKSRAGDASVVTPSLDDIETVSLLKESSFPFVHSKHMIQNALLAIAVGNHLGIPTDSAIQSLASGTYESGRSMYMEIPTPHMTYRIIDDTYNANPDSVCAALETLKDFLKGSERGILALGALKEQGNFLLSGYNRIYETASALKINTLILCDIDWSPKEFLYTEVIHVKDREECAKVILKMYREGDIVVCKGSRSSGMEKVIEYIKKKQP